MAISSIGSVGISSLSGLFHQRHQDFKAMESAVKNGDLTAAQSAMAAWRQDTQNIQNAGGVAATPTGRANGLFQSDLLALTNALQAGDIGNAQKSLATLDKDRQGVSSVVAGQTASGFMSELQDMLQAVQSGNLGSVRKSAVSLQNGMNTFMAGAGIGGNGFLGGQAFAGGAASAIGLDNAMGNPGLNAAAQAAYAAMMKPQAASSLNIQA